MKPGSSHFLKGALFALMGGAVAAAACGSDAEHRSVRGEDGGAGGGEGSEPQPFAGNGGATEPLAAGGHGGAPALGEGGMPVVAIGGVPNVSGGEGGTGGVPDALPLVDCDTIVIADPILEAALRNALNKPTGAITPQEAASLTAVRRFVPFGGITSIAGIECFTGLSELYLGQGGEAGNVQNLAPLRYLKNLTSLDLNTNPLTNLEPLGELPNLRVLGLDEVPTPLDLSPLATAPSLQDLSMRHDNLTDLTPLGQVTTLVKLNIDYAQIALPASASALKSVKVLNATGAFANFDPLAGLTQLTELRVPLAVIDNFAILNQLVNLTVLDISYTGTSSISIVSGMTKLMDLRLRSNQIVDIAALSGLGLLSYVDLMENQVTDLGPLASNTGLATGDEVYFAFNPFNCNTQAANIATMVGRGATVDSGCP